MIRFRTFRVFMLRYAEQEHRLNTEVDDLLDFVLEPVEREVEDAGHRTDLTLNICPFDDEERVNQIFFPNMVFTYECTHRLR